MIAEARRDVEGALGEAQLGGLVAGRDPGEGQAFAGLDREAIHAFLVADVPVTLDGTGMSAHRTGPARWKRPPVVGVPHRVGA